MRRGSQIDPPNRFTAVRREADPEHWEWEQEDFTANADRPVEYLVDSSRSIVSENRSPDVPFRYSLNPYRGCSHGCAYCYARPGHEYLGFSAGLDFETKIVVKHDAPQLFAEFLSRDGWDVEPITFSGVTDCYQPAERRFKLTRQCLETAAEFGQPVSVITKNALVARDLDLLTDLANRNLVHVFLSITTLESGLARDLEPGTSTPAARLQTVGRLTAVNVPVGVMVAPIIPGLNDAEIPAILEAAAKAGATTAGKVLLRLPHSVEPVFREWLQRCRPELVDRVLGRIRQTRGGKLNSSRWGERMVGAGEMADQISQLFQRFRQRYGLDGKLPEQDRSHFRPPAPTRGQLHLF